MNIEQKKETNLEHYRTELEELIEEARRTEDCIVLTTTGEFGLCNHTDCDKCIGQSMSECRGRIGTEILNFLMQEYTPAPTITSTEKKILELLQYEWIARDKSGDLYVYAKEPKKDYKMEFWNDNNNNADVYVLDHSICNNKCFQIGLDFIKWEDDKPWKVKDLLKLKVKDGK